MSKMKADKTKADAPTAAKLRQAELARWDDEGGAGPLGPQEAPVSGVARLAQAGLVQTGPDQPDLDQPDLNKAELGNAELGNAELVQLRIRIIALENLVVALLAGASAHRLELVREMAAYISPRPGVTRHSLTLRASVQMNHLVGQAAHFCTITPP